jgi:acetyl esterase/lipase
MCRSTLLFVATVLFATNVQATEPAIEVLRNQTYVTRPTGSLDADVFIPVGDGPFPGMLVVHGGAWRGGSRAQMSSVAQKFAEHGYTAVTVSYRLAPQSPFPAQLYDCEAAVRWMRTNAQKFRIDPAHIGGFGYSAGGHLVALLGTLPENEFKEDGVAAEAPSTRLQCVLAGGAPCDFRVLPADSSFLAYWLAGTPSEKPENYRNASPAYFISADDPPMFFFSGEDDVIVPISSPQRMVKLLTEMGVICKMHAIKNAGHLNALFDRDAIDGAFAFADAHLKQHNAASRAVLGDELSSNASTETTAIPNVGGEGAPARSEARDGN